MTIHLTNCSQPYYSKKEKVDDNNNPAEQAYQMAKVVTMKKGQTPYQAPTTIHLDISSEKCSCTPIILMFNATKVKIS